MKLSCIIHTRNSAETLDRALASVAWADDIIVVDMESTDSTRAVAAQYTQRILSTPIVPRVDGIRQQFLAEARHDWILVLDSDEHLAADAEANVTNLLEQYGDRYDAFAIPRFNYIAGQIMRGSGWYPAAQIRLFRKGTVRWPDANHQLPEVITGRLLELEPPDCLHIHHRNYEDLRHFIHKQLDYALNDRYDSDPSTFDFSSSIN
jgi:glycosyltransferase involved in cell wall biosynthesis